MTALAMMDNYADKLAKAGTTYYRKKYFAQMLALFNKYKVVRDVWNYVENAHLIVKRFIKKVKAKCKNPHVVFADSVEVIPKGHEQFYLIRLLNSSGDLVWSKIGTTTNRTTQRMCEHLDYYADDGITDIVVDRVWDCGDYPAEMFESLFRAYYIKKYPGTWKKNDRFCGVLFDLNEAEQKFSEWAG